MDKLLLENLDDAIKNNVKFSHDHNYEFLTQKEKDLCDELLKEINNDENLLQRSIDCNIELMKRVAKVTYGVFYYKSIMNAVSKTHRYEVIKNLKIDDEDYELEIDMLERTISLLK